MQLLQVVLMLGIMPVFLFCMSKTPDPNDWVMEQRDLGGFRLDKVDNPNVIDAAEFGIKALAEDTGQTIELVKIHKVYNQLVSGMNYRMLLELKVDGDNEFWVLQVYKTLQGKQSLTFKEQWDGK
jgi:hypothetical protein